MIEESKMFPRFVQAYFGAYLISYVRPQRPWSTELIPLEIPPAVQSSYSEAEAANGPNEEMHKKQTKRSDAKLASFIL